MHFTSAIIAAAAISGTFAAPAGLKAARNIDDIVVRLTGDGVRTWDAVGFSSSEALEATSAKNPGPFNKVQIFFSDNIKKQVPGIENRYRCALEDEKGGRIVVTRGENIDFNFGDNGNPNAWTLKNGPFGNVKVKCDPTFQKIDKAAVNAIRVQLTNAAQEFAIGLDFSATEGRVALTEDVSGDFSTVQLTVGPGIDNQKLRCQITEKVNGNNVPILLNRGANVNKKTFGDGGKGEWSIDVDGNGVASVNTITCDPAFV